MSGFRKYEKYDGVGLAELVQKKEVKPIELVEEAISRIENLNPRLNAVIHKMYDIAMEAAEKDLPNGPFKGVPFLLKDLLAAYAGVPMRSGSRFNQDFIPDYDSEIVKRFKAAGVIIVGKTNTSEYGLAPVTEPELFGSTNNPWNLSRTTGGSSGGSAASVSACIVPLAHGNDVGGSIRIPASCCGVIGLKPTRGRNPFGPNLGNTWHGFLCDHVLTRSVRDSAAMLDATAGPEVGTPYFVPPPSRPFIDEVGTDPGKLRIAFTSKPFLPGVVYEDCVQGLKMTIKVCQELGYEVEEATPQIDGEAFAKAFLTMGCAEIKTDIEEAERIFGRKATFKDFEPATWAAGLLGRQVKTAELSKSLRLLRSSAGKIGQFFEKYDVLMTPTLAKPPLLTGSLNPRGMQAIILKFIGRLNAGNFLSTLGGIDALANQAFQFIPYTPLFNATGQPAMSVPLYWNEEGLPIGMQFIGRYGDEATLFRLASQFEAAIPWFNRRPPVCQ